MAGVVCKIDSLAGIWLAIDPASASAAKKLGHRGEESAGHPKDGVSIRRGRCPTVAVGPHESRFLGKRGGKLHIIVACQMWQKPYTRLGTQRKVLLQWSFSRFRPWFRGAANNAANRLGAKCDRENWSPAGERRSHANEPKD
jgi:hypothetical protein